MGADAGEADGLVRCAFSNVRVGVRRCGIVGIIKGGGFTSALIEDLITERGLYL